MTSDDGIFAISGLVPADGYTLKLTRTGFANWETGTFEVPLGQPLSFRIPLSPQAPAAHVEASSVLPVLDTTRMGVNELVGPRLLAELPSGDLRWDAVTILAPPVGAFNPVFQSPTSPPYLLIDGVTAGNTFNPGTVAPDRISQDAIQAVQVLSNGYPGVFPGAFSGIADVATRSGASGYHGDALAAPSSATSCSSSRITNCWTAISRATTASPIPLSPTRRGPSFCRRIARPRSPSARTPPSSFSRA
jgi:hypothetical protein